MPAFCEELRKSSIGYFTQDIYSSTHLYPVRNKYTITGKENVFISGRSCLLLILGDKTKEIVVTSPPKNKKLEQLQKRVILLSCNKTQNCKILTTVVISKFEERYPSMGKWFL